jgi:hypothetical protein
MSLAKQAGRDVIVNELVAIFALHQRDQLMRDSYLPAVAVALHMTTPCSACLDAPFSM